MFWWNPEFNGKLHHGHKDGNSTMNNLPHKLMDKKMT